MPQATIRSFALNSTGRDFVVGDIHGMYGHLDHALEDLDFNVERDRLFSVGDLIDRGPDSLRALEFLDTPWFFAVMGNHEQMLLRAQTDAIEMDNWTRYNGGEWWRLLDDSIRQRFRDTLDALPYAMQVETDSGRVGIVHADVPLNRHWDSFVSHLHHDAELQNFALWSRHRLNWGKRFGDVPSVDGLHLLVVGHTPMREATRYQNIMYIDTAAAYTESVPEAKLTLLQIHPKLDIHSYPTLELDDLIE